MKPSTITAQHRESSFSSAFRPAARWSEVLSWGIFTDRIVSHLGGNPDLHTAVGVGYGLERLAMLRYGIDDIRKIGVARIA
jgi:phenylalanyl-tRNA synthetase alpha subunit